MIAQRAAGWIWCAVWAAVLYAMAEPWRHMGGLVDERLRWLEGLVLPTGLVIGLVVGGFARDAVRPGRRRCHAGLLRYLLLPPATLTAAGLLVLVGLELSDPIGVVTSAFLAYWAGLDLAIGAWPLASGRPYRFTRPIPPAAGDRRGSDASEERSPWEILRPRPAAGSCPWRRRPRSRRARRARPSAAPGGPSPLPPRPGTHRPRDRAAGA